MQFSYSTKHSKQKKKGPEHLVTYTAHKVRTQGQLFPHKISDLVSDSGFAISLPEFIIFTKEILSRLLQLM